MAKKSKAKSPKTVLLSYIIKGTTKVVKAGDCVLMRAQDPEKPPYVARVEKIEGDSKQKNVSVHVRWYYRPEESIGGRRQFHGVKELFLSDHMDVQSANTIEGKCTVHTFKNYTRLESVGAEDYFCRFEYKAATGGFTPDRVAVYCKCEMPYNPDDLMVQCETCKDCIIKGGVLEDNPFLFRNQKQKLHPFLKQSNTANISFLRFHPACINLTMSQLKTIEHFICPDCTDEVQKKPKNGARDSLLETKQPEPKRKRR